jgi:hypothetical protein
VNWNVYSRILDEKLGDAEYELDKAEKRFKTAKAKRDALLVEKKAFEESAQLKMDDLDPAFAKQTIETSNPNDKLHWLIGSDFGRKGDEPFFSGYRPAFFFNTTDVKPTTKLSKEDHDAIQLSLFFSGNI